MEHATDQVQSKMNRLKNMAFGGGALAVGGVLAFNSIANAADEVVTRAGNLQEIMTEIKAQTFGKQLFDPSSANEISNKMKEIEDLSTRLGLETTFSNLDAGEVIRDLQKGGLQYKDIMNGAAEATIKFAQLNEMAPTAAAELMVQTRAGFQLTGQQMLEAADTVTKVAAASSAGAEDINRGLGNMAGVASQMWGTRGKFEQVMDSSALVALTRTQTAEGSSAGTFVRNFLERLVPQTKQQTAYMASVGWLDKNDKSLFLDYSKDPRGQLKSATEIAKILRKTVGSNKIIADEQAVEKEFALAEQGMGTDKLIKLFHKVFGEQGGRTAYTLLRSGEGSLEEILDNVDTQLSLNDRVRMQMENFNQVKDTAGEAWNTFLTSLGSPLLESGTKFFAFLNDQLSEAALYFQQHPEVSKYMFAIAGGVAALAGIGGIITVTAASFGALSLGLSAAGIGLGTIALVSGGVLLAIGAIAGGAYLIYKNWDELQPYAKAVWDGIKDAISPVVDWVKSNVIPVFTSIGDSLEGQFKRIEEWVGTNKSKIEGFFGFSRKTERVGNDPEGKEVLSWKPPGWLKAAGGIAALFIGGKALDRTVSTLSKLRGVMSAVGRIGGPAKFFLAWVQGRAELKLFGGLLTKTFGLLKKIPGVSGITRIGTAFFAVGKRIIGVLPAITRFGGLFARVMGANARLIGIGIMQIAKLGGSFAWLAARALWMGGRVALAWVIGLGPVGWIIAGATALVVAGIAAWNSNFLGFRDKMTALWQYIKEKASAVWNWLSGLPSEAVKWGENLMKMFAEGITNGIEWVQQSVEGAADTVKQFLGFSSPTEKGPASKSDRWAPNLMKMFSEGITDSLPHLQSATGTVAEALRNNLNGSIEVAPKLSSKLSDTVQTDIGLSDHSIRVKGPSELPRSEKVDLHFYIYQQPGEDTEAFVDRVANKVIRKMGRDAQRANMTMGRGAFGGAT
ncbi:phage tail tape measure protein [Brevibacillus laterosporus]|uniref:phage tail tape measure protein n=1 Tax=Brevibacillus laterosporus TaxID=1465 RepID=UPI002E1D2732|nr:phage tail tape measure protein [Brevibacillus laterosporus]MED1663464.1 phage tail tape measure protein [Brevibacillus laterosporus]MED1670425.1 phage tail tape measure protein [Brevibacillus laterosporus]MED1720697.1 phage tail tape measure protein [Brevibacillus laterosporus]